MLLLLSSIPPVATIVTVTEAAHTTVGVTEEIHTTVTVEVAT